MIQDHTPAEGHAIFLEYAESRLRSTYGTVNGAGTVQIVDFLVAILVLKNVLAIDSALFVICRRAVLSWLKRTYFLIS